MRNHLLIIFFITLLASCSTKSEIPPDVLPPDKMELVLWDLMRADQYLGTYVFNRDTSLNRLTESLKYYQRIFTLHQVTKEQFDKSFTFYRARPILFKAIMDSISTPDPNPGIITAPVLVTDTVTRFDSVRTKTISPD